jgi:hypothetical protein
MLIVQISVRTIAIIRIVTDTTIHRRADIWAGSKLPRSYGSVSFAKSGSRIKAGCCGTWVVCTASAFSACMVKNQKRHKGWLNGEI